MRHDNMQGEKKIKKRKKSTLSRVPRLVPEDLSQEQQAIYSSITSGPRSKGPQLFPLTAADGSLNGPFNAFLISPDIGSAVQGLGSALRFQSSVSDRFRELTILLVAARWDSEFERSSHEAIARHIGFSDAELAAIREDDLSKLCPEEAEVAKIVQNLLNGDLDEEQWDHAREHLSNQEIFDLTALVGYYSMLALQLRVFRV